MNQKVWEKTDKMVRIKETYKGKEKESVSINHKIWGKYFGIFPLDFVSKQKILVTFIPKSELTKNIEKARKNKYFQRYKTGNEEQKEWSPNVSISYNWMNPK